MAGSSEQYSMVLVLALGNLTPDDINLITMDYPTGV